MSQKTLVALSGSADSLVTAWLLKKQGMQVRGVYLDLTGDPKLPAMIQFWERKLGITIQVVPGMTEIEKLIPIIQSYIMGGKRVQVKVMLQQKIVFPLLFQLKLQHQFQKVATAHRVNATFDSVDNMVRIFRYQELSEDEAGLLIGLNQAEVADLEMPLGGIPHEMIRKLGEELQLTGTSSIAPPDWEGLVRIAKAGLKDQPKIADVVSHEGARLASHPDFTTVSLGDTWYEPNDHDKKKRYTVWEIDGYHRKMVVGEPARRVVRELYVEDASWFALNDLKLRPIRCALAWEKSTRAIPVKIVQYEGGRMKVFLETPLRGADADIFNGQALLWVSGAEVLGGARVYLCK